MKMNLQKLLSQREGNKGVISRYLEKIESLKENFNLLKFNAVLESLESKKNVLDSLNEKILSQTDAENTQEEIMAADEYMLDFEIQLRELRAFRGEQSKQISTEPAVHRETTPERPREHPSDYTLPCTSQRDTNIPPEETECSTNNRIGLNLSSQTVSNLTFNTNSSQFHRLPKLTLPKFSGDILTWQTFWDSFESTVHLNAGLNDIQRFSYLKSQLESEASKTIEGFALTNANYARAIDLLKERYGQDHKIIHATMQALLQLPAPMYSFTSLKHFYDSMESYVRSLESMGQFQETYGSLLVPIVLDKLPSEIRKNLAREHGDSNWRLADLRQALKKELNVMEAGNTVLKPTAPEFEPTASFYAGARPKRRQSAIAVSDIDRAQQRERTVPSCVFCKGQHAAVDCRKYINADARIEFVKRNRLCYNCLRKHQVSQCKSRGRCQKCNRKHHTSICKSEVNAREPASRQPEAAVLHTSSQHEPSSVLLKTAIATVSSNDIYTTTAVLFDEGAQRSFITEKLANELQLRRENTETLHLSSFGGDSSKMQHLDTTTVYLVTDSNQKIAVHVLIVPHISTPMTNHVKTAIDNYSYLRDLRLAHPATHDHLFNMSMLIGADYYWEIVEDEIIRGDGPTAVKSKLGYLLSGPIHGAKRSEAMEHIYNVITSPVAIETALEKFWALESAGIIPPEPSKNNEASEYMKQYQQNSVEYKDGRYYARLPWKQDHEPLPTNYEIARKRTLNTIDRLQRQPDIFQKYGEIIADQEKRGFIERVQDENQSARVHYIPHHPIKKDSATTPVRIVYDCSCKQSRHYPSLNDCLESTPPILNELTSLLVRFRLHDYAVSTDIEKAFLHVGLHEDDKDVSRFFWFKDATNPDSPLVTYRFRVVLFGATCSPFMLNATLLKHLDLNRDVAASQIIARDLYVDNVISSFPHELDAINFYKDSRSMMTKAGMNLRSWTSNSALLRSEAKSEGVLDSDDVTKILGLRWNVEHDTLAYAKRDIPQLPEVTKRTILKYTSQIYDPLGLLSPVTIRAKLLLQDIWRLKYDWDCPLPPELQDTWFRLAGDLIVTMETTLPRKLFNEDNAHRDQETYLHVFADASMKSYGAAAYLNKGSHSVLVMAKTRVAPLKMLTLPQLELMAALIGARLAKHLQPSLNPSKTVMWSDSQIVLHWLTSTKQLKRFVRNRVEEIRKLIDTENWRYCPTNDNPADLLTRGLTADKFMQNRLWMRGPEWLTRETEWPVTEYARATVNTILDQETTIEEPTTSTESIPTNHEDLNTKYNLQNVICLDRHSSYRRLIRVTAFVVRFARNCKVTSGATTNTVRATGFLSARELDSAEKLLISHCQATAFTDEIQQLKSGQKKSALTRQLKLFIDTDNIIRCNGRIHNAPVDNDTKFPLLLPKKHIITGLIVKDAHIAHMHSGVNATVAYIRQKFWIPAIRQVVRTTTRKCVTCKRVIGKPYLAPDPPPLPKSRVQDSPPFTVSGVDFAGPLNIRTSTGSGQKTYICLFTCAVTRAVHLEIVSDLSTDSFIQAFRRFASRKSLPQLMISDNATTFTAAATYLKRLSQNEEVAYTLGNKGITWQFIPKRAPWFGGFWERMIGLTKVSLKKILGNACVTMETLQTVIVEIEALLNDRPLTHVSSSIDDLEPLTPAHLLYGRRILPFPGYNTEDLPDPGTDAYQSITKRAKTLQHLIDQFWRRWRTEYITQLREQHRKSGSNTPTIQKGDVVQVHDEGPRIRWRLAVVQDLIPGSDGRIRAATIRTSQGITTRPIVKLYPLEVISDERD